MRIGANVHPSGKLILRQAQDEDLSLGNTHVLMVSLSNHEDRASFDKLRMRALSSILMVSVSNHEARASSSFDKLRMRRSE
jgi:hypothetical protein